MSRAGLRGRTWTERVAAIDPRAVLTERARAEACRRVGKDAHAVAAVARDLGVGWATVMRAVGDHGRPLVDDPTRLDLVADRTTAAVEGWLAARSPDWLAQVGRVALDPWRGYANALVAPLGHATVVVDHFHAIRLANAVVDQVRRRVQQATLGHRGRKCDPLYRIRKLLLTAQEQLTQRGWVRLRAGLTAGDPTGEVTAAWQGKELLRAVYASAGTTAARVALDRFLPLGRRRPGDGAGTACPHRPSVGGRDPRLPHHRRLLQWAHRGRQPVIKKVKRVGHGFRNFANYRLRLLLHCDVSWQMHRTGRLRGRCRPLVA
jgi:transposase